MNQSFNKTVLVTGASSGIGLATAKYLAHLGFHVLASVRKEEDRTRLTALGINTLLPLFPLDLTKQEEIYSACREIQKRITNKELPSLYALIHIAGGGQIAPVELLQITGFRDELEKRLVGPITVTQELLPLLRTTRGRIIWIATPGLFPVPWVADIHAPDFAVNYLARTLNIELKPDGIKNVLIRCGGINTGSPKVSDDRMLYMLGIWPQAKLDIYRQRLMELRKRLQKFDSRRTEAESVARLIAKVLLAKHPKARYQIGYMSRMGAFIEKLPQSWSDWIMMRRG